MKVLSLLLACFWGYHLFAQQGTDSLSTKEKALLLNISYFAPYGIQYDQPERYEQYLKIPFEDSSVQYDYHFSYTEPGRPLFYVRHSVSLEKSLKDAANAFLSDEITMQEQFAGKLASQPITNLYSYGQESHCLLLLEKGVPTGMIYRYRKDKLVGSITLIGLYFDNANDFKEFIVPIIRQTEQAYKAL
ncbi:MAG: hypothetical protein SFW35_07315 [Chitinophagales bacterium]|nr:hypothetical protein [Chitinophagales bacterium]